MNDIENLLKKIFAVIIPLVLGLSTTMIVIIFWIDAFNPTGGETGIDKRGIIISAGCSLFPITMFILLGFVIYCIRNNINFDRWKKE